MPVEIDELIAEIEPEPQAAAGGDAPPSPAEGGEPAWYCAQVAQALRGRERRERLVVD